MNHLCFRAADRFSFSFYGTALTVQGADVSLPSGSASFAAIDTGTTLIGGPSVLINEIFNNIPGSAPGSGDYESYYTYRSCLWDPL